MKWDPEAYAGKAYQRAEASADLVSGVLGMKRTAGRTYEHYRSLGFDSIEARLLVLAMYEAEHYSESLVALVDYWLEEIDEPEAGRG